MAANAATWVFGPREEGWRAAALRGAEARHGHAELRQAQWPGHGEPAGRW